MAFPRPVAVAKRRPPRGRPRTNLSGPPKRQTQGGQLNSRSKGCRTMKIAILGAGNVGGTLGRAWAGRGHEVFVGVPRPDDAKTQALVASIGAKARAGTVAEASAAGEVLVLAMP